MLLSPKRHNDQDGNGGRYPLGVLIVNIINSFDGSSSFLMSRSVFMETTLLVGADEADKGSSVAQTIFC